MPFLACHLIVVKPFLWNGWWLQNARPVLPDHCPVVLRRLMQHCWSANPEKRPNFNEIVNTLEQFEAHLNDNGMKFSTWHGPHEHASKFLRCFQGFSTESPYEWSPTCTYHSFKNWNSIWCFYPHPCSIDVSVWVSLVGLLEFWQPCPYVQWYIIISGTSLIVVFLNLKTTPQAATRSHDGCGVGAGGGGQGWQGDFGLLCWMLPQLPIVV